MTHDRSSELGPADDQGNRGTCLAFAASSAHALARLATRGRPVLRLSEEALYYLAKRVDGNATPGTTPRSVGRGLAKTGQPAAARWPYDATLTDQDPLPTPPTLAFEPRGLFRASLGDAAPKFDDLRAAFLSGLGVILGIDLWPGFYAPVRDIVPTPAISDLLGDGHAVMLAGVDDDLRRFRVRNSWGPTWGASGHAWMAERAWLRSRLGAWVVRDDVDSPT